jgi:hypothetical protein
MSNPIILSREHTIFAAPETNRGVLAAPVAADLIIPAGNGQLNQVPGYTDSEEIVDSRSLLDQFRDAAGPGTWSLPMYLRLAGPGVKPQGASLFKAAFGAEAVASETSVTYTLAKALPSFSLWMKYGGMVLFAAGATANEVRLALSRGGAVTWEFSGGFMRLGWCGTDKLGAAITYVATPITTINVADARKFAVGARIVIGTDANGPDGGLGYQVTAVDLEEDLLTISPGIETSQLLNAAVTPWLPVGTKIGAPVESRHTSISFDGGSSAIKIKAMELTLSNNIQYLEEEISDDEYVTDYVEDRRSVTGSVTLLARRDDVIWIQSGMASGQTEDVAISMGEDEEGKTAVLAIPKARLTVPEVSPTAPTVDLQMQLTGLGATGEDEISLVID